MHGFQGMGIATQGTDDFTDPGFQAAQVLAYHGLGDIEHEENRQAPHEDLTTPLAGSRAGAAASSVRRRRRRWSGPRGRTCARTPARPAWRARSPHRPAAAAARSWP